MARKKQRASSRRVPIVGRGVSTGGLAALRAQEPELRLIADSTPVMLAHCSRDHRYLFVNRAYAKMLGLTPNQIVGKQIRKIIGAEAYAAILPYIETVLRGKTVEYEREIPYRHARGFMCVAYVPDKDEQGHVIGWVESIGDITTPKRAEAALVESEARFRIMADAAPVMLWTSGPDKLCTNFNKPWLTFTGRTIDQELGNGWAEGVHPDDLQRCLEIYGSAFAARREFRMEYRLRRYDGQYRWILDHGVPRLTGTNEFVGYIGSCVDITDRRHAEAVLRTAHVQLEQRVLDRTSELRESEQTVERLFQFAPDAMVITDTDGRIGRVNHRGEGLFGYPLEDLIGKRVEVLLPKRLRRQYARHRSGYLAHARVRPMGRGWDLLGRRKDGSEFPVDITLVPLPGRDGSLIMTVIRDITKRKQAETALRVSEERYRSVVAAAHDAFVAINSAGDIIEWNHQAEATFGWSQKEAVGRSLAATIIPPAYQHAHAHGLQRFLVTGVNRLGNKHIEMPALHRDGHEFPVELTVSHIRLGQNIIFTAFLHDITARRQLERELVEISERERQRFGQELHDTVAQTLTGVTLMSTGLQHQLKDPSPSVAALAARITQCAEEAARQTHELSRGLFPLELQQGGLVAALRELADTVTSLHGIRCRCTSSGPVADLDVVEARQLFRIAQEATTNAVKHSRSSRIEIRLTGNPGALMLTVRDNGVGLKRGAVQGKRMGLHIMNHRANVIGAILAIGRGPRGGTVVTCRVVKRAVKLIP